MAQPVAKTMNTSNFESLVKTTVCVQESLNDSCQFHSFLGEVHFKVKMTTSMGKLKKSYAERQGNPRYV